MISLLKDIEKEFYWLVAGRICRRGRINVVYCREDG